MGIQRYFEDLSVGMTADQTRTVTERDIEVFAEVSGDRNPVHLDEAYARETPFKGRIAHGLLSASYISALLGNGLPGPGCIYVSQSLRFKAPVRIGDEVLTRVEITDLNPDKRRATLRTTCQVGETVVIDGEASIMVPGR